MLRFKLFALLLVVSLFMIAPSAIAHDTELIEWEFFTMDAETADHVDEYPWKGYAFVYAWNSTNIEWGDFHFKIVGQDVTNVLIMEDPAPTMSKPAGTYSWVVGTDANNNGTLDFYFYGNPVLPGEGVTFTFYTDNTANQNALFGLCGYPTPVPEPGSLIALSGGLMGLAGYALRRRR